MRAANTGSPSTPPDVPGLVFLAVPLFDLVMFVLLFGGAIHYRRKPAAHKSLMLLTAINFLPPAIARIPILTLQNLGPPGLRLRSCSILLCLIMGLRRRRHWNGASSWDHCC